MRRAVFWLVPVALGAGWAGAHLVAAARFGSGFALVALSIALLRWPLRTWTDAHDRALPARHVILAAICVLAVFFRTYHLDPPGLWGDDALNGLIALDVLDGKIGSPFSLVRHAHSYFHALTNFVIAGSFWAFGASPASLRLPGIISGVAAVPLLHGTIAPLFGSRVALLAAFFFASSTLQVNHSKVLLQVVLGQLFFLSALFLLVRGITGSRRAMVWLSGLPLALCLYTYHSTKLAPFVFIVFGAVVWRQAEAERRRAVAVDLLGAAVVFCVACVPALAVYAKNPMAFLTRTEVGIWHEMRSGSWSPLWRSLWRSAMAFHYQQGPVTMHWFGIGTDPALNAVVGFLSLHGLVESVRRWRESRHILLLTWFAIGLVPGLLSSDAPRIYRMLLAASPLYVWAGLTVARLHAFLLGPGWERRIGRAATALLVVSVPFIDFDAYFRRTYTHPGFRRFQAERMVAIASKLRDLGSGWTGHLLARDFDSQYPTLVFLARAWNVELRDARSLVDLVPVRECSGDGILYAMSSGSEGAAAALQAFYPGVEPEAWEGAPVSEAWTDWWWRRKPPRPPPAAVFFALPCAMAESMASVPYRHGLVAEYRTGSGLVRRTEPYPYYAFFPPTFPRPFTVRWRGRLRVPDDGSYRLEVVTNGRPTLRIDRQVWSPERELGAGSHALDLEIAEVPAVARLELYWQGPGKPRQLVPPEAFTPPS